LSEGMMEFPCGWTRTPVLFVLYKRLLREDKIHFVLSLRVRPLSVSVSFQSTKHAVYLNIPFFFPLWGTESMALSEAVH
jgi:hypothetical protein